MKAVRHMKSTGRVSSGAITPSWVKSKFNLPGSAMSVKKHIFKPMKWKYYLRTRKPGVPAGGKGGDSGTQPPERGGPLCLKLQSKLKQRWNRYTLEFVCDVCQCILSSVVRSFAPSRLGMVVDWSPGAVRRELPCAPAQVGEERAQRRAEGVRGRRRCP